MTPLSSSFLPRRREITQRENLPIGILWHAAAALLPRAADVFLLRSVVLNQPGISRQQDDSQSILHRNGLLDRPHRRIW